MCLQKHRELIRPLVHDTVSYLHKVLSSSPGKLVVVEGAQATMLDIDFGEYQQTFLASDDSLAVRHIKSPTITYRGRTSLEDIRMPEECGPCGQYGAKNHTATTRRSVTRRLFTLCSVYLVAEFVLDVCPHETLDLSNVDLHKANKKTTSLAHTHTHTRKEIKNHFYPRDAMLARVIEIVTCLSVCPSVRPSRAGIVSKRIKLAA